MVDRTSTSTTIRRPCVYGQQYICTFINYEVQDRGDVIMDTGVARTAIQYEYDA